MAGAPTATGALISGRPLSNSVRRRLERSTTIRVRTRNGFSAAARTKPLRVPPRPGSRTWYQVARQLRARSSLSTDTTVGTPARFEREKLARFGSSVVVVAPPGRRWTATGATTKAATPALDDPRLSVPGRQPRAGSGAGEGLLPSLRPSGPGRSQISPLATAAIRRMGNEMRRARRTAPIVLAGRRQAASLKLITSAPSAAFSCVRSCFRCESRLRSSTSAK